MKDRVFSKRKYDVVTFDCYGTLIDWEKGIKRTFGQFLGKSLVVGSRDETRLFELYEREERRIEAEVPFRRYREVMKLSADHVAMILGNEVQPDLSDAFAEELPKWGPFPDTNFALERIALKHQLGILSNIDDDLLKRTIKHFTVPFELVVTAQRVQSYKPRLKHFEEAKKIIGPDKEWLHVAGSLYHDIEPASAFGLDSVWVNRQHTPTERRDLGSHVVEVASLTELAEWLESQERHRG